MARTTLPRAAVSLLAICLTLTACPVARAADAAPARPVGRVAVLAEAGGELKRLPLAALVGQALAAGGATLVERDAVDAALREQQVSALADPAAVGGRVRLGRVLRADLLVFLQTSGAGPGRVRVTVCESASGVRLSTRGHELADGKIEPLAAAIAADVKSAAATNPATRVLCAVPPFVSKDLGFEHAEMKAAYAALAEQAVTGGTDVLTVELAELQALEREIALAADAALKLERPLPLYLLGEYRNDGVGADRRVTLSIALRRGAAEVGKQSRAGVNPGEAADAIAALVRALLAERGMRAADDAGPAKVADSKAEVEQLKRRALDSEATAQWDDAADLYEACLLLAPDDRDARRKVIEALRRGRNVGSFGSPYAEGAFDRLARSHARDRRKFAHIDYYCRRYPVTMKDEWEFSSFETFNLYTGDDREPKVKALVRETRQIARNYVEALILFGARERRPDALLDLLTNGQVRWQFDWETEEAAADRIMRLIDAFPHDDPRAARWTMNLAYGFVHRRDPLQPKEGFIGRLEAHPSPQVRKGAADIRATLKRAVAEQEKYEARVRAEAAATTRPATKPALVVAGPGDAVARSIHLRLPLPEGERPRYMHGVRGWTPAGAGRDLIWTSKHVYLMDAPGAARVVWPLDPKERVAEHHGVSGAWHDGRYLWIFQNGVSASQLVVLDADAKRHWTVGAEQGLPELNGGIVIVPLAPGRVFVSGSFFPKNGSNLDVRGWCAIATVDDATGGCRVDVFHEATRVVKDDFKSQLQTAEYAFSPTFAEPIGKGDGRRIVLGRQTPASIYRRPAPPLVIDPEKRTVALWADAPAEPKPAGDEKPNEKPKPKFPGGRNGPWGGGPFAAAAGGALVWVEPTFLDGRAPTPSWRPRVFRAEGAEARVSVVGQFTDFSVPKEEAFYRVLSARHDGRLVYARAVTDMKGYERMVERLRLVDLSTGASAAAELVFPDGTTGGATDLFESSHYGLIAVRRFVLDYKAATPVTPVATEAYFTVDLPPAAKP